MREHEKTTRAVVKAIQDETNIWLVFIVAVGENWSNRLKKSGVGKTFQKDPLRTSHIGPGLSYHRYSVIFSADSEIFAFSAMFRAEPADFNFEISGHNWFSDEHFWTSLIQRWTLLASSKQAKTMKKANKKCCSFNIDAEETRNRKFQNNF